MFRLMGKTVGATFVSVGMSIFVFGLLTAGLLTVRNIQHSAEIPWLGISINFAVSLAAGLITFFYQMTGRPQIIKRIMLRITR